MQDKLSKIYLAVILQMALFVILNVKTLTKPNVTLLIKKLVIFSWSFIERTLDAPTLRDLNLIRYIISREIK